MGVWNELRYHSQHLPFSRVFWNSYRGWMISRFTMIMKKKNIIFATFENFQIILINSTTHRGKKWKKYLDKKKNIVWPEKSKKYTVKTGFWVNKVKSNNSNSFRMTLGIVNNLKNNLIIKEMQIRATSYWFSPNISFWYTFAIFSIVFENFLWLVL